MNQYCEDHSGNCANIFILQKLLDVEKSDRMVAEKTLTDAVKEMRGLWDKAMYALIAASWTIVVLGIGAVISKAAKWW
jgi:hypothetical protein